jgi:hypothetical protein
MAKSARSHALRMSRNRKGQIYVVYQGKRRYLTEAAANSGFGVFRFTGKTFPSRAAIRMKTSKRTTSRKTSKSRRRVHRSG